MASTASFYVRAGIVSSFFPCPFCKGKGDFLEDVIDHYELRTECGACEGSGDGRDAARLGEWRESVTGILELTICRACGHDATRHYVSTKCCAVIGFDGRDNTLGYHCPCTRSKDDVIAIEPHPPLPVKPQKASAA
jgi:hypothetical protein